MRLIQKVSFRCKKNQERFRMKFYCYQILHFSDYFSTYWGTYHSGAQLFVYPSHRMQLPTMLATSSLHISGHHCRQIACRPGTSLGVGRDDNHLAPNQGCMGGLSICSHLNEVMRSWIWAAECGWVLSWSKRMVALSIPCLLFWISRLSFFMPSLIALLPYT